MTSLNNKTKKFSRLSLFALAIIGLTIGIASVPASSNPNGFSEEEIAIPINSESIDISTARFANVAFSNGSLLEGFKYRIENRQPFSAPNDIRRYFVVKQEAGILCMLSALLGETNDIFFPKLSQELNLSTFSDFW